MTPRRSHFALALSLALICGSPALAAVQPNGGAQALTTADYRIEVTRLAAQGGDVLPYVLVVRRR